jgi:hypothetical protein
MLQMGVMEPLCAMLQPGVDAAVQQEAALCITNIASAGANHPPRATPRTAGR